MPRGGGMFAVGQVHARWPTVQILVLSMHQEAQYVREALKMGASGYLVKDSAPAELELALRAIGRGETYLSSVVSRAVVGDYVDRLRTEDASNKQLTPRQTEILVRIAKGKSTKEIARELDLAVKTVDSHRSQLMKELGVHEVTGLVRYALRNGLIQLQD
jgi:DNA-binding NarL/FixJ family response regulator